MSQWQEVLINGASNPYKVGRTGWVLRSCTDALQKNNERVRLLTNGSRQSVRLGELLQELVKGAFVFYKGRADTAEQ